MKALMALSFGLLTMATSAKAATQLIVRAGGQSATILMMAVTENPDANAFYDLLTVPATVQGNKESKQIAFTTAEGKRAVEITCAFSRLVRRTGSCVFALNLTAGMTITSSSVEYVVVGDESLKLASLFRAAQGQVFQSTDGHLTMTSSPGRFEILYR